MARVTYLNDVGSFECIVEHPEAGWLGVSGGKETPFLRLPLRVTEPGSCFGHVTVFNVWLSNAAFDQNIATLKKVFGFDGDLNSLVGGSQTLAGLPCNVTMEDEVYEGKTRCRPKWLNPPGGGGAKKLDDVKVNALLKSMSARAKAIAKSTKADPTVGSVPATSTAPPADVATTPPAVDAKRTEDDDVPF